MMMMHFGTYSVSQKKSPPLRICGKLANFPRRLGFQPIFTCLLRVPIYARLYIRIFIQLPATLTKLCHIKCDHPACVSVDDEHFEHIMVVARNVA